MSDAQIIVIGYTSANAPTCLYVGNSRSAANAAILAIHTGGTYTRVAIHSGLPQPAERIALSRIEPSQAGPVTVYGVTGGELARLQR